MVAEPRVEAAAEGASGRACRLVWPRRAAGPGDGSRAWVARTLWIALFAVVVGVSLWFGAHRPAPSTPTARMEQIASELRCPICIDESAAQANTSAARAIRADIAAQLREGRSAREILGYMVSRYGRWILLSPPASGLGLTVWIAPMAVTLAGLGVVAVAWARAVRRFQAAAPTDTGGSHVLSAGRDPASVDPARRVDEEWSSS